MKTLWSTKLPLYSVCIICFCLCSNLNSQIINIESQRIITDTTGWAGNLGLATSASKNTKSYFTFNGSSHVQYKSHKNLYLAIMDYNLVNAGGEDFGNSGYAHLRYNRKMNSLLRIELFTQVQFNEIALIQMRYLNGAGVRFKLSQLERAKFYFGATYMYEYEEITGGEVINRNNRLSSYFSFTLMPEEGIRLSNTTYIQPRMDDFQDFRVSNDSRLSFNITEQLSFTTVFHFLHDSRPPVGVPNSTFEIRNGLGFTF